MSIVAFPAGLYLDRSTVYRGGSATVVDFASDGTPLVRTLNVTAYRNFSCRFSNLFQSEKNTLTTFVDTNMTNTITWTIDGENYSGIFLPGVTVSMTGALYNVEFSYYAELI
jgi:hypothetical protein